MTKPGQDTTHALQGLVDKFFQGGSLVQHLLDSYNDFIANKLNDIMHGFNPIEISHQYMPDQTRYKYVLRVSLTNPKLTKPLIVEKDGSTTLMFPSSARNRNFTYASPLYADAEIHAMVLDEATSTYNEETKTLHNVHLGKMPLMVKSRYCMSNSMDDGECAYDYGGYFIVNGNEKVVINQDRIAENRIYVFVSTKSTMYSHVAEVRSIQENRFSVPKTTSVKLSGKPNQFGRVIRVNMHRVKQEIPLVVLFRALGVESDKDILRVIWPGRRPEANELAKHVIASLEEGNHVRSQGDAFEYINRYMIISGYNKDIHTEHKRRMEMLGEILCTELLPHCGRSYPRKALYLGVMVNKLVRCFAGVTPFDDRDSYVNKRVDTPGVLMANLFRQNYGKMIKDMRNIVAKDINCTSWKTNTRLVDMINQSNVNRVFKSTVIDGGMRFGLSTGNWGIKSNKTKQGVAQVLNRLTYSATLSHLRRVNTPIEKMGKMVQPRKLHGTQLGVICPAETPEGVAVGLVKNMALSSSITVSSNSTGLRRALMETLGVVPYLGDPDIFEARHVVVNCDILGAHPDPTALYARLKAMKRAGVISSGCGVVYDAVAREVVVCTEGGRCLRPFLVVSDDGTSCPFLDAPETHAAKTWAELCTGEGAVVEYLDVDEVSHSMVAMSAADLTADFDGGFRYRPRYTHLEIDPSLFLGVLAASIPFSNHNQAPRNCYQSAMGKQAIGVYASNYRRRFDIVGHILDYPQKPIVQTRVAKIVNNDNLPCGVNVIVAIAAYTGFNQEDSVMLNRAAVDRGMFISTHYKTYKEQNNKNHSTGEEEFFCAPDPLGTKGIKPTSNYGKLMPDGFMAKDTPVQSGDVIIGKCMPQKEGSMITNKDVSVVHKGVDESIGYVDDVYTSTNGDGYTFAKVKVRSTRIPCIGDKFCMPGRTEVLTRDRGWVRIDAVTTDDLALQLDPRTGVATFAGVAAVHRFRHEGVLRRFVGAGVDLSVTHEHKMAVVDAAGGTELVEARRVERGAQLTNRCSAWNGEAIRGIQVHPERLAYLYGCMVYRGKVDARTNVVTVFRTLRVMDALADLGAANDCCGAFVNVRDPSMADLFGGSEIQTWPMATRRTAAAFLDGFFGTSRRAPHAAMRPAHADAVQTIGLAAGRAVAIRTEDGACHLTLLAPAVGALVDDVLEVPYDGHVFCIEVPTHVFYVRDNGKALWTGNSSRHGQKGTVGMVYTHEDMPFTKDGIVPDIIINPHAIPSRMTIAQLIECIMGKACCASGAYGDGSPFQDLAVSDIAAVLRSSGLEQHGNEVMYNSRTGEQIDTEIFMGPTFYQRLKHMVNDKVHSRLSCGPVVLLTRQPAEGRARDGGLRMGEMEADCNLAHGISGFLKERFVECSDNYRVFVCDGCGKLANVNPEKGIYVCKSCKGGKAFTQVRLPYASKLLFQEIQTMSISTKFLTRQ